MIPKQPSEAIGLNIHMVYGVLFALIIIAGFVAFVLSRSLTDDSSQSATVSNSAPTITVAISSVSDTTNYSTTTGPLTLTDNSTVSVYVHGTVTDSNGCTEVTLPNGNWIGSIYHGSTSGTTSCTANSNNCYTLAESDMTASDTCTSGGADLSYSYEFTKAIQYYADATDSSADTYSGVDWSAYVAVSDGTATGTGNADAQTFEVATLTALTLDASTISFGSLALGATSSEQTMAVENTGNNQLDVLLSGTNFNCSSIAGTFNATNSHYNLTASQAYASGTALTTSGVTSTAFNQAKRTTSLSPKSIYWTLQTPSTGVAGSCSSTITVTAVND